MEGKVSDFWWFGMGKRDGDEMGRRRWRECVEYEGGVLST